MFKTFTTLVAFICISSFSFAQSWSRLYLGPSAYINSMCTDPSGGLYIDGGPVSPGHIAVSKYSSGTWVSLGSGISVTSAGGIMNLCVDPAGNLYAAGGFHNSLDNDFVAKWDGTSWTALDTGLPYIAAICTGPANTVYMAGSDDSSYGKVYKWNGTNWQILGSGANALHVNYFINTMCTDPAGNVYIGGLFSTGSMVFTGTYCVMKWDGTVWSMLDTGNAPIDSWGITSLISDAAGNVYATGMYIDSTGREVYKWNGSSWSTLGTGSTRLKANGLIRSLTTDKWGNIYAAGAFTDSVPGSFGNFNNCNVAKWNGSNWSWLGTGSGRLFPHSDIWTICADSIGTVYAGGALSDDAEIGFIGKFEHPAGIAEMHGLGDISIYPNPASTFITISTENTPPGTDYYLFNCMGKVCKTGKTDMGSSRMFIDDLPAGVYTLQVGQKKNAHYQVLKQ